MPSKSAKQARFMAAAAHDPEFARKAGIPQEVAKEFNDADQAQESITRRIAKRLYGKPSTKSTDTAGIRG